MLGVTQLLTPSPSICALLWFGGQRQGHALLLQGRPSRQQACLQENNLVVDKGEAADDQGGG
jgi:hypothetical protein